MNENDILSLHSLIKGSKIQAISVEYNNEKIVLEQKQNYHSHTQKDTSGTPTTTALEDFIISDQVGYFSFDKINISKGDVLDENTKIGKVETLETHNDILSKKKGRVLDILVKEGMAVEYGQPLIKLR